MSTGGDIGGSIELLLAQCLPNVKPTIEITIEEAKEQRQDEALALSSIYETKFTEKIPNRIWIIDLDLPRLTNWMILKKDSCSAPEDDRPICDYYLRGHCKFRNRCRLRHVSKAELDAEKERASQSLFSLEIRFPVESVYPSEPPLIAFLSQSYHIKPDLCLKISARLMKEAAALATDGAPAIFSILALLDDENELKRIVESPLHPLSHPPNKSAPEPEPEEVSFSDSNDNVSDSDDESSTDIKNYLKLENRLDEKKVEETALTLALKRKRREDKLYDRSLERIQQDNIEIRKKFKKLQVRKSNSLKKIRHFEDYSRK